MEPYSVLIVLTLVPVILDTFGLIVSLFALSPRSQTARVATGG
jgi:hypothetical protein